VIGPALGRRRWGPWLVFGLCALLVVDVLAWATWRVLALERAEQAASAQADTAQRERLALWQIDSLVSTLIARESARPYFEFRSQYAADLPYGRAWDVTGAASIAESPLASGTQDPVVRLHFQIEPQGELSSPQAIQKYEYGETSADSLRAQRLVHELESVVRDDVTSDTPGLLERTDPLKSRQARQRAKTESAEKTAQTPAIDGMADGNGDGALDVPDADLRQQLFDIARSGMNVYNAPGADPAEPLVSVGLFQPRWLAADRGEPELVFERSVTVGDQVYRQGVWIDWPLLRAQLLAIVNRSIPDAALIPVLDAGEVDVQRNDVLATIPLRLSTGSARMISEFWTPARVTLAVSWLAAIVALVAIGVVLRTAMRLAERRGRFVAAITHELRSPLTSFRLHTDLLERAHDDAARGKHTGVLRREADRLGSVIENVLVYAGLRGGTDDRVRTRVGEILEPLVGPLRESAAEAGLEFETDISKTAADAHVRVRAGSIERIISNLVENACRYASIGDSPGVVLSAAVDGRMVRIRVADTGPGVALRERERIFTDFYRGEAAAGSHRGIGLGLALGRGLARAEGGDLRCVDGGEPGAVFELSLPIDGG